MHHRITSLQALRDLIGEPWDGAKNKVQSTLDEHCQRFIAASPFLVVSTSDRAGRCDASPRGDAPDFVRVLDERTVLIPDRTGNQRVDS